MNTENVLARARALLLDFDGPVCSVFAGIPATTVADQLRDVLRDCGHTDLSKPLATSKDPFEIFRYAATLGETEAQYVESAFTAHEVEAIASALPTEGAHDLIQTWHDSGRPLAIVSNNSSLAISTYLDLYNMRSSIDFISARTNHDTSQLKPAPYLLFKALSNLQIPSHECVFIGDSITDIEAGHAAQIQSVGYANKPGKDYAFRAAQARAVIKTMRGIVPAR
jgi:HAD superfamily hydrolase (TIGR01549 family)